MSMIFLGALATVFFLVVLSRLSKDETISMPLEEGAAGEAGSVERMIMAGRKIEAIKALRAQTGLGLKEAKEEVEAMARTLRPS